MNKRGFLATLPFVVGSAVVPVRGFSSSLARPGVRGAEAWLSWVIVRFPYVTDWDEASEDQFSVRAVPVSTPGAVPIDFSFFGLADTRQAVFFNHLPEGRFVVTATVDAGLPMARWVSARLLDVKAGYPASVQIDVAIASAARFELEGTTSAIDSAGPQFAVVFADLPPPGLGSDVANRTRRVLEVAGAKAEPRLRRASSGEVFILFRMRDNAAGRVFEAIRALRNGELGDMAAAGKILLAVVARVTKGAADLIVIDPDEQKDARARDRGYPPRRVILPTRKASAKKMQGPRLLRGRALGLFIDSFGDAVDSLRYMREEGSPDHDEGAAEEQAREAERQAMSLRAAISDLSSSAGLEEGLLAGQWSICSIEEATVADGHALVDLPHLRRFLNCASGLVELLPGQHPNSGCSPPDVEHATGVYGMLSSRLPPTAGAGASADASCAPGMVSGIQHVAVSLPSGGAPPIVAARDLADLLRWATGRPLKHRQQGVWPALFSAEVAPSRVINISRRFGEIGLGADADPAVWAVLASALEEVTTVAFGGRGAVVVLLSDNAGQLISEMELSLPCRNSILIVTATDGMSGQGTGLSVNSGPPVSVFAPSRDVELLALGNVGNCRTEHGTYSSYAVPTVTSTAALVAAANPALPATAIAKIVRETATVVDASRSGVGRWIRLKPDRTRMMDAVPANPPIEGNSALVEEDIWFSLWYGHGRIDPTAAVARARQS